MDYKTDKKQKAVVKVVVGKFGTGDIWAQLLARVPARGHEPANFYVFFCLGLVCEGLQRVGVCGVGVVWG